MTRAAALAREVVSLIKLRIAALAALTAAAGHAVAAGAWVRGAWAPVMGTLLMASAAAVLNNLQDARLDRRMARTRDRPLAAGRIRPRSAGMLALFLSMAGLGLLSASPHRPGLAMVLGLGAIVLYNGVYAWLKRRNAFAAIPGALVGVLPPVIGWAASGAPLQDPRLVLLAGFYFLWQVPHFWLYLLLRRADYVASGLPLLTRRLDDGPLLRVTGAWIVACATAGLLAVTTISPRLILAAAALAGLAGALGLVVWLLRTEPREGAVRPAFTALNLFALVTTLIFVFGG